MTPKARSRCCRSRRMHGKKLSMLCRNCSRCWRIWKTMTSCATAFMTPAWGITARAATIGRSAAPLGWRACTTRRSRRQNSGRTLLMPSTLPVTRAFCPAAPAGVWQPTSRSGLHWCRISCAKPPPALPTRCSLRTARRRNRSFRLPTRMTRRCTPPTCTAG